jgi:DNA-directed RNA polymerase subunit F
MEPEDLVQVGSRQVEVKEVLRRWRRSEEINRTLDSEVHHLRKEIHSLQETIEELREDLGSLRVLEAFMRSGVIKDLGLKEDPETQHLLRKFFQINLKRALQRPETLVLSDPAKEIKRSAPSTEGPENERRQRAA